MTTAKDHVRGVREAEAIRKANGHPAGYRLELCLQTVARNQGLPIPRVDRILLADALSLFGETEAPDCERRQVKTLIEACETVLLWLHEGDNTVSESDRMSGILSEALAPTNKK